jgi:hypothetical protein
MRPVRLAEMHGVIGEPDEHAAGERHQPIKIIRRVRPARRRQRDAIGDGLGIRNRVNIARRRRASTVVELTHEEELPACIGAADRTVKIKQCHRRVVTAHRVRWCGRRQAGNCPGRIRRPTSYGAGNGGRALLAKRVDERIDVGARDRQRRPTGRRRRYRSVARLGDTEVEGGWEAGTGVEMG